ncbi:nucleoside recognition domain-containing protein [Anaerofustis sp.]|uniref:spore maturation protein n=1 Tax=Anaerofustis sp. TaxID=1872517 RepID=UPI0025C69D55|nr:nucleoside recognition domain-containing protein [Anaerofustis sp.]
MLNFISSFILIFIIIGVLTYGIKKKVDIYATFVIGAKKGIKTTLNIFPFLLAFTVSVSIFRESGLSDFIVKILSPLCDMINFKSELLPLMIFRPISGSGASAVLCDIFKVFTPDSFIGLAASVMMGSTETTLYVLNVYLAGEKITKLRYALKACLLADVVGFILAYIICILFFG